MVKKVFQRALICLLSLVIVLLIYSLIKFPIQYLYRIFRYGESDVGDYKIFPERIISASDAPHYYEIREKNLDNHFLEYQYKGDVKSAVFSDFMDETGTTALIVLHKEQLIHEGYYNGHTRESTNTSFSSVKSIVSLLIGIAIEDGYITSEKDSIAQYIQKFKKTDFEAVTIEDLLLMRSPIRYREGLLWFGDDAKTYYMPDLRSLALQQTRIDDRYDSGFLYNNYHPLLLGIILERSTGQSVSSYFEERIWTQIGTEFDVSWSLDSETSGFEKMESGLNFKSIDFIKIGTLLINQGRWNGRQIINPAWLEKSIYASFPLDPDDYKRSDWLSDADIGYQYMWYSLENEKGGYDFFAAGKYGQYLYISPENEVVIVRNGFQEGRVDYWPLVLREIANTIDNEVH